MARRERRPRQSGWRWQRPRQCVLRASRALLRSLRRCGQPGAEVLPLAEGACARWLMWCVASVACACAAAQASGDGGDTLYFGSVFAILWSGGVVHLLLVSTVSVGAPSDSWPEQFHSYERTDDTVQCAEGQMRSVSSAAQQQWCCRAMVAQSLLLGHAAHLHIFIFSVFAFTQPHHDHTVVRSASVQYILVFLGSVCAYRFVRAFCAYVCFTMCTQQLWCGCHALALFLCHASARAVWCDHVCVQKFGACQDPALHVCVALSSRRLPRAAGQS